MKTIAFICGGNSVEKEISCLTGLKICQELKKKQIDCLLIYLDNKNNFYLVKDLDTDFIKNNHLKKGTFVNKNLKNYFESGRKKYYFDYALILGHGKNIEEGVVKTYLDFLNIPCLGEDVYNGVVVQDKIKFKMILDALSITNLPYEIIYKYEIGNNEKIENITNRFNFPMIVKPSSLGSSIGISKVNDIHELKRGLYEASSYDTKILIEPYINEKIEYNIAIIGYQETVEFSDVEKVNQSDKVLSFYDKYDYSDENEKRIINPKIDSSMKLEIMEMAKKVFSKLNLCGIIRFDFIYDETNKVMYLNEANLIPGSLAYYLFASKYNINELIEKYVNLLEKKENQNKLLSHNFQEGFMTKIDLSKLKK